MIHEDKFEKWMEERKFTLESWGASISDEEIEAAKAGWNAALLISWGHMKDNKYEIDVRKNNEHKQ